MPYVIVYNTINQSAQITFYKVCCRTKECLNRYPFNPFNRFGTKKPFKRKEKSVIKTDVGYLDVFIQIIVSTLFFLGVSYILFHLLFIRHRVALKWNDEQEEIDPDLIAGAETPDMQIIIMGHKDQGGFPISGQHSFLDYCRLLACRAAREQNIRESQLIDPSIVRSRIYRHDLRKLREMRESTVLRWKVAYSRLNRDKKFVKIAGKWVFVSKRMKQNGFLKRQLQIDQRKAIQRYTEAIKMFLKLKTKSRYDTKYLKDLDKYDVSYLLNLGREKQNMHMIFFKSVGLGHELFKVQQPIGYIEHNNPFEAMFFHGPYFYPWNPSDLISLFGKAKERFLEDSICLRLSLPIVIIGEIRGRYADLHRWLQITGLPYRRKLLFLGGYVERGSSHYEEYGIECLSFIASLKLAYPRHVFMLRGSAETTFSFAPRYNVPMDDAVLSAARQMCNCMPLTALIDEEYLAVSSGISPYMMEDLFEIEGLERPLRPEALPHSLKWLLFGQPSSMSGQFDFNEDNLKFRYGLRAVHRICQKWGLKAIIRSRNDISINPLFFLDNHFITINSCPTKKTGGVAMLIDGNLGWFFFKLRYQMEELEFSPDPYTSFLKNEDKKNE